MTLRQSEKAEVNSQTSANLCAQAQPDNSERQGNTPTVTEDQHLGQAAPSSTSKLPWARRTHIFTRSFRVSSRSLFGSQSQQHAKRKHRQHRRMYAKMPFASWTSVSICSRHRSKHYGCADKRLTVHGAWQLQQQKVELGGGPMSPLKMQRLSPARSLHLS